MHSRLFVRVRPISKLHPDDITRINNVYDKDDFIAIAKVRDVIIGYLIFDDKNKMIKSIFVYPEFRNKKIAKILIHTVLFLFPDLTTFEHNLFKHLGFDKKGTTTIADPMKLDLIYSPYIVKNKSYWYCTYSGALINIKDSEILKEKQELYKLGFLVPLQCDFNAIFNYILCASKEDCANSASIVTTTACNMNCGYCFEKNKGNSIIKDPVIFEKLWDKLVPNIRNNFRLNFFGGEPTLNKEAIFYFTNKLREYAKTHNFKYTLGMITNGTLLDNTITDFFYDDEFSHIQITLDGPKEIHDKSRGMFDTILFNSKKVLRITKTFGIRMNVTKSNYDSIPNLMNYLNDYYTPEEKKKISLSIGFVYDKSNDINISKSQYEKLNQILKKNNFFGFHSYKEPRLKIVTCAASTGTAQWFDLEGNEYICEHQVGNLVKEDIKNLSSIYLPKDCVKCAYYPVCGGLCWSANENKEPMWSTCVAIKESVKYYVRKFKDNK